MSLTLAPQFTQINYTWTNWKTIQVLKTGNHQYDDDNSVYTIYFYDGPEAHICSIWKGTIPETIITNGTYTQVQNNIDKSDFETNFKPYGNKSLEPSANVVLGYATSVNGALTIMRATAYAQPSTNAQRSLLSSNADDTSAGTGARTIKITYYDQTLAGPFYEIASLNGVTPVNTVASNICFIEKIEVNTVGNQLSNVGTITLKAAVAGGGITIGTIAAGDGVTYWCHHYVGTNKICRVISVIGSIDGINSGALEVHKLVPTSVTTPETTISPKLRITPNNTGQITFDVPITVVGPAFIAVYGRSDATSGNLDWFSKIGFYEV